jgi:hypothetical protein
VARAANLERFDVFRPKYFKQPADFEGSGPPPRLSAEPFLFQFSDTFGDPARSGFYRFQFFKTSVQKSTSNFLTSAGSFFRILSC